MREESLFKRLFLQVKERPFGLNLIVGVHTFLWGGVNFFFLLFIFLKVWLDPLFKEKILRALKPFISKESILGERELEIIILFNLLLSSLFIISGIGLFRGKERIRVYTVYFLIVLIIFGIFSLIAGGPASGFSSSFLLILNLAWLIWAAYYLTRSDLGKYFK